MRMFVLYAVHLSVKDEDALKVISNVDQTILCL
jgi:hypothetical protein